MTLNDTVPFASVAEGDEYFDPLNNNLYVDEWWASDVGHKAGFTTTFDHIEKNLVFSAINPGYDGNLISVHFMGFSSEAAVQGGGTDFEAVIHTGVSTAASILARFNACARFTAIATVALAGTAGTGVVESFSQQFFNGGVDPDTTRSGNKLPALCAATRKINNLPFSGVKVSPTQVNAFPRMYTQRDGSVYTQPAVPDIVKQACCEEALAILKYGNTTRYKLQAQGVKSWGFGNMGLRETFVSSRDGDILSGEAMNMLRPYMRRNWLMGR